MSIVFVFSNGILSLPFQLYSTHTSSFRRYFIILRVNAATPEPPIAASLLIYKHDCLEYIRTMQRSQDCCTRYWHTDGSFSSKSSNSSNSRKDFIGNLGTLSGGVRSLELLLVSANSWDNIIECWFMFFFIWFKVEIIRFSNPEKTTRYL